jgi:hypothetical protein
MSVVMIKRILSTLLVAGMLSVGNVGCAEKSPARNAINVTTPSGTTVTIEKPVEPTGGNHLRMNPSVLD